MPLQLAKVRGLVSGMIGTTRLTNALVRESQGHAGSAPESHDEKTWWCDLASPLLARRSWKGKMLRAGGQQRQVCLLYPALRQVAAQGLGTPLAYMYCISGRRLLAGLVERHVFRAGSREIGRCWWKRFSREGT